MNKAKYRITNWREYNKSLVNRGRINFWISDSAISSWSEEKLSGKRGASICYSDTSIVTILTIMAMYRLGLRQATGFMESIFELSGLDLKVPDFSTVSRRRSKLKYDLVSTALSDKYYLEKPVHVVIDSTGVKIFGEGEWKVKIHKHSKRRTWRKLHVSVNESTSEILSAKVTGAEVSDGEVIPELMKEIKRPISKVSADGAYDHKDVYDYLKSRGIRALIPPRENARLWSEEGINHCRNRNIVQIFLKGKKPWRLGSGYSRRSISENTMFRFKKSFGERINSIKIESQAIDIKIRCSMLNKMFEDCKPISVKVN